MGYYMVILFAAIMTTLVATHRNNLDLVTPQPQQQQSAYDATTFLDYRSAVMAYVDAHPTFTGSVSSALLPNHYPATFLATAGNYVSPTGAGGRVTTAFANLPSGAGYAAMVAAGGDAAIGTSTGTSWISLAPDATKTPTSLNTAVPAGYTVSVTQTGK